MGINKGCWDVSKTKVTFEGAGWRMCERFKDSDASLQVCKREREGRRDMEVCELLSSGCAREDVGMCKKLRRGLR